MWDDIVGLLNQYARGMTAGAGGAKKSSSREPSSRESESIVISLLYWVCLKARSFVYESAQLGPESVFAILCQYDVPLRARKSVPLQALTGSAFLMQDFDGLQLDTLVPCLGKQPSFMGFAIVDIHVIRV